MSSSRGCRCIQDISGELVGVLQCIQDTSGESVGVLQVYSGHQWGGG